MIEISGFIKMHDKRNNKFSIKLYKNQEIAKLKITQELQSLYCNIDKNKFITILKNVMHNLSQLTPPIKGYKPSYIGKELNVKYLTYEWMNVSGNNDKEQLFEPPEEQQKIYDDVIDYLDGLFDKCLK